MINFVFAILQKTSTGFLPLGFSSFDKTIKSQQNSLANTDSATTHTGSLIASNSGDVKLTAGQTLTVEGSDVLAANNALLLANNINIVNSTDTYHQTAESKAKSAGLTVALAGTIGNAANGIVGAVQQANSASSRGNKRLAAAYDTKAALTAVQAGVMSVWCPHHFIFKFNRF